MVLRDVAILSMVPKSLILFSIERVSTSCPLEIRGWAVTAPPVGYGGHEAMCLLRLGHKEPSIDFGLWQFCLFFF